jgi:ankyrin repeat protein
VENNADVSAQDDEGKTALDWAKHNNHIDIIAFLAEKH